jgi:mono/diheme cytochrome c family protein
MELTLAVLPLTVVSMLGAGADAKRGADLFTQQRCTECHSVQGNAAGPSTLAKAPDLGRRLDRDYTPAGLASRIWNHAPQMWNAMKAAKIEVPNLNEQAVGDIFAYFYAARYFDKPGDAGRGKHVFEEKQCGTCHSEKGMASAVKNWKSLRDPVELVERMWNHAPQMIQAAKNSKVKFPRLDASEMGDMLVYLQNTPELRKAGYQFRTPEGGADGKALLESKGCTKCHTGARTLDHRIGRQTLTEIAAAMWNHAPEMRTKASELTADEMRTILGYLWSSNFFGSQGGNAARGEKIFAANCSECHGKSAPALEPGKKAFSSVTMVAALWQHGPKMLEEIEKRQKAWPRLTPSEAQNLIAYLNGKN